MMNIIKNCEELDDSQLDEDDKDDEVEQKLDLPMKRELPVELVSAEEPKKKKRKKSEKCKVCGEKGHLKMDCDRLPEERRKELQDLYKMKVGRAGLGTGRKKNKKKQNGDILAFEEKENTIDGNIEATNG